MNKLIIILFLMPLSLFAQTYNASVDVPGKNAAALFSKAKEWYAESFTGPGVVPPTEDIAKGTLTGRESVASLIYSNSVAVNINISFIFNVSVKDGQYQYEIDNIMIERGKKFPLSAFKNGSTRQGTIDMYKAGGQKTPSNKTIEENIEYSVNIVNKVNSELNRLIDSLAEKMMN
jgi:hypothetical protein